jgi:hypothetical protein
MEGQQFMGKKRAGRRLGMSSQRSRWHPQWDLCLRLLITCVYKPGPAIINADELSCFQMTDSVVPLTQGIRRLL